MIGNLVILLMTFALVMYMRVNHYTVDIHVHILHTNIDGTSATLEKIKELRMQDCTNDEIVEKLKGQDDIIIGNAPMPDET